MHEYHGPAWWPIRRVGDAARAPAARRVVALWLAVSLLAVASAVLEARWDWSGMPVEIAGLTLSVTIYPPLALTLVLAVWLGPSWGMIPAYLAAVASALVGGMPWPESLLFALATPVELVIIWGSMVVLDIHPDLERKRDVGSYLAVGILAAVASSLAGLIWIDAQRLDLVAGRRIWQGWVLGDVLQMALLVPVFRLAGARVRGWIDRALPVPPRHAFSYVTSVGMVVVLVAILTALVAQGVWMSAGSLDIPAGTRTASGELLLPRLREIALFLALLLLITVVTTTSFASALARMSERERGAAQRDSLTGCLNRRAFYQLFDKEADRSKRLGLGLSLIYFDVDHFKRVNDTLGHETGDEVLRQLARRVQSVVREHDVLFRWGGEEFLILLPHTDPAEAPILAERVREAVGGTPIVQEDVPSPILVTLSLGTAGVDLFPTDPDAVIAVADAACYIAKRAGRNRVEDGRQLAAETRELPAVRAG